MRKLELKNKMITQEIKNKNDKRPIKPIKKSLTKTD